MPELPEVETVKRGLAPLIVGARVLKVETRRRGLRYDFPDNLDLKLRDLQITDIQRRGKYLLFYFSDLVMLSHLGMSGSWRLLAKDQQDTSNKNSKHDHLIIYLLNNEGEEVTLIYNDPRRFGIIDLLAKEEVTTHKALCKLGVEPLSDELTGEFLAEKFVNKKQNLKQILLDQSVIAGLGNIYVCEVLFMVSLSPFRVAATLSDNIEKCSELATAIKAVLEKSLKLGGSSLKDYVHSDGSLGYFQNEFFVYNKEGQNCGICDVTIKRVYQSGRSSFYCEKCQK